MDIVYLLKVLPKEEKDKNKNIEELHQHMAVQDAKLNYIISLLERDSKIHEKP